MLASGLMQIVGCTTKTYAENIWDIICNTQCFMLQAINSLWALTRSAVDLEHSGEFDTESNEREVE